MQTALLALTISACAPDAKPDAGDPTFDLSQLTREQVQLLLNLSKRFDKLLQREREVEGMEACAKQILSTAQELNSKTAAQLKEMQRVRAQIQEYVSQDEQRQADVYRKMDARKAAKCLAALDVPTASKLLSILPPKTQAMILAEMPRQWQARIQRQWQVRRDQLRARCD